jgi:hypothetical protein
MSLLIVLIKDLGKDLGYLALHFFDIALWKILMYLPCGGIVFQVIGL